MPATTLWRLHASWICCWASTTGASVWSSLGVQPSVSESNPWCAIASAETALGMESHPFTTASPFAQICLFVFARTVCSSRPPGPRGPWAPRIVLSDAPHEQMTAVQGVGANVGWPAALLGGLRPGVGEQDVGALQLVERVEARRALRIHRRALAAQTHRQRLQLEAGGRDDAGHSQDQRHVLGVVNLVKQRLAIGNDVHCGGEQEAAGEAHGIPPWSWTLATERSDGDEDDVGHVLGAQPRRVGDVTLDGGDDPV